MDHRVQAPRGLLGIVVVRVWDNRSMMVPGGRSSSEVI